MRLASLVADPNEGLREWMEKAKQTPVIDYDAVKREIEMKRGQKLLTIAEWRRRVNPKQREEYRKQLIREARARREQDERLEKDRLGLGEDSSRHLVKQRLK